MAVDRLLRLALDAEAQAPGELAGAQHPHRVLAEAQVRIADRPHQPAPEVDDAVDVVDHREVGDVVEQGVDGEVAAEGVLARRAVGVVAGDQQVARLGLLLARLGVAAEGRDLDRAALVEVDVDQPEAPADDARVREQAPDLVRPRVGADVEVLRRAAEHQVAHAAAHQVGLVAGVVQPVEDLQGVAVDVRAGDGVIGAGDDPRIQRVGLGHAVIISGGRQRRGPREGPGLPALIYRETSIDRRGRKKTAGAEWWRREPPRPWRERRERTFPSV